MGEVLGVCPRGVRAGLGYRVRLVSGPSANEWLVRVRVRIRARARVRVRCGVRVRVRGLG